MGWIENVSQPNPTQPAFTPLVASACMHQYQGLDERESIYVETTFVNQ